MKQKFILLFALLLATILAYSQVTIGSAKKPVAGALLMLDDGTTGSNGENASKGLGIPRVELKTLTPLPNELAESIGSDSNLTGVWDEEKHIGLVVYNIKERATAAGACPGLHIWDGTMWQAMTPYREGETRTVPVGTHTKGAITLLSSYKDGGVINASDPKWAEFGKVPTDYPIAATPSINMTDADGNSYASKRFYAGYRTVTGNYQEEKNFSCNSTTPVWVAVGTPQLDSKEVFVDGIWITSNVYSTQKAGGGAFDQGTDIDNMARLNPAYMNYTPVAIKVPVGGLSTSSTENTIKYGESSAPSLNNSWNYVVSQKDYASKFGLNYTRNQANQVCSTGWHLPDDAEWGDLTFYSFGGGNAGAISRARPNEAGGSSFMYRSQDNDEASWGKWSDESSTARSGFDARPSGAVLPDGETARYFRVETSWWSDGDTGRTIILGYYNTGITHNDSPSNKSYLSVRCIKD